MIVYPPYNEGEENWMLIIEFTLYKTVSVFSALTQHLDLESRISRVIRQGYLAKSIREICNKSK